MRSKNSRSRKTIILGLGNILCSDEGLGSHFIKYIRKNYELPKGVEAIDGGTAGMGLVPYLDGVRRFIVVDAIDAKSAPGTIFKFSPSDMDHNTPLKLGAHEVSFLEVLKIGELIGLKPKVAIIAVQPGTTRPGLSLSKAVHKRFKKIAELVMEELNENL